MGNAFMPSVASSLNAGGQDALEQIMKQRLFQQQMQQSMLQGQGQLNDFRLQNRQLDAQEAFRQESLQRYEQDRLSRESIAKSRLEATAARTAQEGQARQIVAALMADGKFDQAEQVAMAAGITPPRRPAAPKQTLAEKLEERKVLRTADAETDADLRRRGLKPTKVAKAEKPEKDDSGAPSAFRQALANRVGTTGFENPTAAKKSVQAKWQTWRQNYPGLDESKVTSVIADLYGSRPKTDDGVDMAAIRARVLAKMSSRP